MRETLRTMWASFTTMFTALNRGMTTVDNYAKWAEAESSAFEAEARVTRQSRIRALREALSVEELPEVAQPA